MQTKKVSILDMIFDGSIRCPICGDVCVPVARQWRVRYVDADVSGMECLESGHYTGIDKIRSSKRES